MAGSDIIIGVDEVGRGSWAGPVVAAAVALPIGLRLPGVKDSKMLSATRRLVLAELIRRRALGIGIGWSRPDAIDRDGLTQAVRQAMLEAITNCAVTDTDIVIDGNFHYLKVTHPTAQPVIKADRSYPCVSAASIIAKVARDQFMIKMDRLYPGYAFAKHVGYGTPEHRSKLFELGPSPIHRFSFKPLWAQASLLEIASVN